MIISSWRKIMSKNTNKNNTELTKRQEDVLKYIKKYVAKHGFPPATREIGAALGLTSPATVHTHIKKLVQKGYLRTTKSKFRTIEVVGNNEYNMPDNLVRVPMLGKVTAGSPIEAIEKPDEFFDLPVSLVPKEEKVFVLEVSGESMINKGIYDGDVVIVQEQKNARNGDIVVAMNDNDEVTLKTFYKEKDHIRLQPENHTMDPIIVPDCKILGKVAGVFRKM